MATAWPLSPWVVEHRDRISFALQVFPIDIKTNPSRHLLTAGRLAETLGFDAFFLADRPAWALECWVHLAAVAVTTERIRHPVLTAWLAADVDNLSNGRLMLGLGIGWDDNEAANLGKPFPPGTASGAGGSDHRDPRRVGRRPFTFHGRYYDTTGARVTPPPVQRPSPPVMIAGGGKRVTLRQVAQYADASNLAMFEGLGARTPEDIRRKVAVLQHHCAVLGRPFDTVLRTHLTGWLILAEDEARLQEKLDHYFPEGLEQRFSGYGSGFAVAGTPERVVSYYQALVDAGIQYFIVQTYDAAVEQTIRLLAEEVVPKVRASS